MALDWLFEDTEVRLFWVCCWPLPLCGKGGVVRVLWRNVLKYLHTMRQSGNGFLVTSGGAHLLHQHVDVRLGIVQHVAVRPAQALHGQLHRSAVDIDPSGSARGQELPLRGDRGTALG